MLDLADVVGKRIVPTRLMANVTVRAENAAAALEVMSRFAADPRWLIYLPPTMSPCATSPEPGLLEHPREAFGYFQAEGVGRVVCQRKHMGSRAVVIVCRDEAAAARRFGVRRRARASSTPAPGGGSSTTGDRGGVAGDRPQRVTAAGLWDELASDWFCLDCELMPWSAKAQELLKEQYAAVGSAAGRTRRRPCRCGAAAGAVRRGAGRLLAAERQRADVDRTSTPTGATAGRCASVADLRLAPFHLLAGEGGCYADRDHAWHLSTLARLADGGVLMATESLDVDVADPASPRPAWPGGSG